MRCRWENIDEVGQQKKRLLTCNMIINSIYSNIIIYWYCGIKIQNSKNTIVQLIW